MTLLDYYLYLDADGNWRSEEVPIRPPPTTPSSLMPYYAGTAPCHVCALYCQRTVFCPPLSG